MEAVAADELGRHLALDVGDVLERRVADFPAIGCIRESPHRRHYGVFALQGKVDRSTTPQGRELRLQQQYFFVACSLKDYLEQTLPQGFDLTRLPDQIIFQLNDTHPVIAVPELMRLLVDEHDLTWEQAWDITTRCFAYTCHTLLPEAL